MYWRHESPTQKLLACEDRADAPNIILLVCFKIFAQTPDPPVEGSYVNRLGSASIQSNFQDPMQHVIESRTHIQTIVASDKRIGREVNV